MCTHKFSGFKKKLGHKGYNCKKNNNNKSAVFTTSKLPGESFVNHGLTDPQDDNT